MSSNIDDFVILFPDEMREALNDWISTAVGSDIAASTLGSWMLGLDSTAFDSGVGLDMTSYLVDQGPISGHAPFGAGLRNLLFETNGVNVVASDSTGDKPPLALPGAQLDVATGDVSYLSSGPGADLVDVNTLVNGEYDGGQGHDTYFVDKPEGTAEISECLIFDFQGPTLLARSLPDPADRVLFGFEKTFVDTIDTTSGHLDMTLTDGTHYNLMFMYSDGTPVDADTILASLEFAPEDGSPVAYGPGGKPLLIVAEDIEGEALQGTDAAETFLVTQQAHNGTIDMGGGDDRAVIDARNGDLGDTLTCIDGTGSDTVILRSDTFGRAKVQFLWTRDQSVPSHVNPHAGDQDTITFADISREHAQIIDEGHGNYLIEDSVSGVSQRVFFSYNHFDNVPDQPPVEFSVVDNGSHALTLSIVELF